MTDLSDVFEDLPEPVQAGLRDLGWKEPTPVQERVIPLLRAGKDLIVQARTGSGKTGAFGLPIMAEIDPSQPTTQALVLAPTRELANQVAGEFTAMGKHQGVRCVAVYGGVGYQAQIQGFAEGAHAVVGTPGRILDHLGAGRLRLGGLRFLVLDEADELLSLGFWPDMREIHSYLPSNRQSALFSATIPEKVRSLSRVFLREPEFVTLSEGRVGPEEIDHFFTVVPAHEKEAALVRILEYEDPESAIIFCNTKDDVRYVTAYLQRHGFDADSLSGDLNQVQREQVMARTKAGQLRFLVATDVAARGIDISDLSHVISYAAPDSPEVYVHRTGRTGRAGRAGVAISLVSGLDIGNFRWMRSVNRIEVAERKLPTHEDVLERIRERLAVKAEQELRGIPERERAWKVDRLIPVVEKMAASEEGRRDLAVICAQFLVEHRPETTVREPEVAAATAPRPEARPPRGDSGRPPRGDSDGPRRGRRRRRRPSRR